jgi:hypothetical protein
MFANYKMIPNKVLTRTSGDNHALFGVSAPDFNASLSAYIHLRDISYRS